MKNLASLGRFAPSGCRLHNSHRQPGVIEAQLREPAFCERHAALHGPEG